MGQAARRQAVADWLDEWTPGELDMLIERRRAAVAAVDPWLRNYRPFASQDKFHRSTARFKGFSGPIGSGKSAALCREGIRLAFANPGLPGLVGAPTYRVLEDVTRAAFLEACDGQGIPYRLEKSRNAVYLRECRSVVLFRSLENPERLRGQNLAWFAVDELTYCKPEGWTRLEGRLRHPSARQLCGFAVWTPKGFDWVYEKFLGDRRITAYEAVQAAPGENTALPPGFYESLKASYDPRFYRQEVLGEYLSQFAGQVYYAFDRRTHVVPVEFDPRFPLCWAMDFNVDPMSSVLVQIARDEVRVLDEIILRNSNTPAACKVFRERAEKYLEILKGGGWATVPLTVRVYGDAAGNARKTSADGTDWELVKASLRGDASPMPSFHVPSASPSVKARVNAMNARLESAAGERRLVVHQQCRELIADLEQVAYLPGASEIDKRNPKRTHISDALGYLVEREFPLRMQGGPRPEVLF